MSAACPGVWLGSMPITVRLRISRRTLSSLACNSPNVGNGEVNADTFSTLGLCTSAIQWMLFEWRLLRRGMRFLPIPPRGFQGIDLYALPPRDFIAGLVQLPMMPAA